MQSKNLLNNLLQIWTINRFKETQRENCLHSDIPIRKASIPWWPKWVRITEWKCVCEVGSFSHLQIACIPAIKIAPFPLGKLSFPVCLISYLFFRLYYGIIFSVKHHIITLCRVGVFTLVFLAVSCNLSYIELLILLIYPLQQTESSFRGQHFIFIPSN